MHGRPGAYVTRGCRAPACMHTADGGLRSLGEDHVTTDVLHSGSKAASATATATAAAGRSPDGSGDIVRAVHDMYARHPFPPSQRKYSYRRHAGYDISETSVGLVNQTMAEESVSNARAQVQDIMTLDVASEFDYIVSWGTVHHLPDPARGVAILARALKPGGILRLGVYGYYGNWERRVQQEIIAAICEPDDGDDEARIAAVRTWASGDRNFKNYYTAPPVDLGDDNWVVDEFLHVWEQHLQLREVVAWLRGQGMRVLRMTDYYDQEIPLDIRAHTSSPELAARVEKLPFESQCHVIDMIVRPYWISLFAQKASG